MEDIRRQYSKDFTIDFRDKIAFTFKCRCVVVEEYRSGNWTKTIEDFEIIDVLDEYGNSLDKETQEDLISSYGDNFSQVIKSTKMV